MFPQGDRSRARDSACSVCIYLGGSWRPLALQLCSRRGGNGTWPHWDRRRHWSEPWQGVMLAASEPGPEGRRQGVPRPQLRATRPIAVYALLLVVPTLAGAEGRAGGAAGISPRLAIAARAGQGHSNLGEGPW